MSKIEVKMVQHLAGSGRDDELVPGETYKLEEAFAKRLIEKEYAEPVKPPKEQAKRQTATAEKRETAVVPGAEHR
jgi:hypothetical protein